MATILTSPKFTIVTNGTDKAESIVLDTKAMSARRSRQLPVGMLQSGETVTETEIAGEHTAEPIKDPEDIYRISDFLVKEGRYRDNMLFIVGINFGLRVSDLLQLRFSDLIGEDMSFKTTFPVLEKKTKNTRKVRRNRYISINEAVMDAVTLYLEHSPRGVCTLSDYLFRSQSNNGSSKDAPMSRMTVDRILKGIGKDLSLTNKMSSHTLRKTFAYHQLLVSGNDPRKLLLLQKMFGHASVAQTLDYIGLTGDEIREAYMELNLGKRPDSLMDSELGETVLDREA